MGYSVCREDKGFGKVHLMIIRGKKVQEIVEIEISERELGYALHRVLLSKLKMSEDYDDSGCDWVTDKDGKIYINYDKDWCIYNEGDLGALVDAQNILFYNGVLKLESA